MLPSQHTDVILNSLNILNILNKQKYLPTVHIFITSD